MGLKFRRGSTAQQSGSLAFGEPYVNTTLGTLIVGGAAGDIILSSTGTGSTGNFGAISGSGLDITGNANIAGNLTLGGTITIGDASTDNVVVNADLSSSIIPNNDNAFDLGSAAARYRAIYGTNIYGAINATNGIVSGSSQITYASISSIPAGIVSGAAQITPLLPVGTISGSSQLSGTSITDLTIINLTTVNQTASVVFSSGSNRFGDAGNDTHSFTGSVQISGSIVTIGASTATSFNGAINATNGVVSGSSQITYTSISSIPAGIVSGSSQVTGIGNAQLTNSSTTIGTTAIALGASATTIAGLTSVTSTAFVGALTGNASTATTAAALTNARTINGTSFDGSANITIPNLVSGSSQITYASIASIPAGIVSGSTQVTPLLPTGTVSGSSQVTLSSTTGYGTVINQNLLTTSNVQFNSLGIGMAASATAGRIDASNDVVAFSTSDIRFKENIVPIENALDKISKISGNTYDWKVELKDIHGYEGNDVGVIAQEVEAVLPQLVQNRDNGYKAVKYDKLVALLIEGIKEQQTQIHSLTIEIEKLKEAKGL